jgi:hypothetical protein
VKVGNSGSFLVGFGARVYDALKSPSSTTLPIIQKRSARQSCRRAPARASQIKTPPNFPFV